MYLTKELFIKYNLTGHRRDLIKRKNEYFLEKLATNYTTDCFFVYI